MIFEFFKDNGLAHYSYIVGCEDSGEVVIIDPKRDIDDYLRFIHNNNLTLKYIINTHPHADFVSGHNILAKYTEAENIYHESVPVKFKCKKVKENDNLKIGNMINIRCIETPGHTPYCMSFILEENGEEKIIFTGDFLFIGDIGRPDLLGETTKILLLEQSYESALKLYNMPDKLIVCPSHGEGSFCGKNLKGHHISTIGIEKTSNCSFKLVAESKEKYIENLDNQAIETPSHFQKMGLINISGADEIKPTENIKSISIIDAYKNYNIIDMREPATYASANIPGSINISMNSNVSLLAGSVLEQDKKYVVMLPKVDNTTQFLKEVQIQFSRVGIDKIIGNIRGNIGELIQKGYNLNQFKLTDLNNMLEDTILINLGKKVLDNCSESIELSDIEHYKFEDDKKYALICDNGFRSMTAVSILNKKNISYILQ